MANLALTVAGCEQQAVMVAMLPECGSLKLVAVGLDLAMKAE